MASRPPDFAAFIAAITVALRRAELPFMLIGGQAVLLHGQPRLTEDIDITLGVDPTRLAELLDLCDRLGLEPVPEEVEAFVRDTFVLPALHPDSLMRVDFVFSTTPYEREAIARAEEHELDGVAVPFATAEDLIIHKVFAGRPRDLEDAVSVVRRQGARLDWDYIERWAAEFGRLPGREKMPAQIDELRRAANGGGIQ